MSQLTQGPDNKSYRGPQGAPPIPGMEWCGKHGRWFLAVCSLCGEKPKAVKTTRPVKHGTAGAYSNQGCRCDLCRKAASADRARRRNATPEKKAEYRRYMSAYYAALSRLAREHPKDFKRILFEEQTRREQSA